MQNSFFYRPILNSPYAYPNRHWELDSKGQPTQTVVEKRREPNFVTPIPAAQKRKGDETADMLASKARDGQRYEHAAIIGALRIEVDKWRALPESAWRVTPETARLLKHWRSADFAGQRPFFCQVEAVEVAIWLHEVAPQVGNNGKRFLDHIKAANESANPGLFRIALKLATGAGKTTVMAMLIAWQTINAVRRPASKRYTRGFLIVAPGLTIKDRLQVLMPNDANSYYRKMGLVPIDLLRDMETARIVITNYHQFKARERLEISKGTKQLLQGQGGEAITTLETPGQMLHRVMPSLMAMKNVLVINDEAHHCYREKPNADEAKPIGEDRKEAEENNEAARLWISGLDTVQSQIGIMQIMDLSATPFFLRGSGFVEGTLFPWVMSDFSLMDAIECGIVKLPRVPIADNITSAETPIYRNLWDNVRDEMPRKGRAKGGGGDPSQLPAKLLTALSALYAHYERVALQWEDAGMEVPPCFIVVCNNTSTSKLVYDYIAGYEVETGGDQKLMRQGALQRFSNYDANGQPFTRPRTLLIDSQQLESGEGLDAGFREVAAAEIEQLKREAAHRGDTVQGDLSESELLRAALNTVGKAGKLGASVRCVVSVSMLTEGWDANNVTHILGLRAFGTQLLCEQVVGRALRRQNYELNEEGLFDVEYADVLGIPFDFNAEPTTADRPKPTRQTAIQAVAEKSRFAIRFPNVRGYRVELPKQAIAATFNDDSKLRLTPELVGPTITKNAGIIGESVDLSPQQLSGQRRATIVMKLTTQFLSKHWHSGNVESQPEWALIGQIKPIVERWLDECLECVGGTAMWQLSYESIAEMACKKISEAITATHATSHPVIAVLDPYNASGGSEHVYFLTSKQNLWTPRDRCHINHVVIDSTWEAEFCRIAESHPKVLAYVKNHALGFEVPYQSGGVSHHYRPDFIVLLDDGRPDPLHLVVEIKGYRNERAKEKKAAIESYWIPGVNHLKQFGRWAFAEFRDPNEMQAEFDALCIKSRGDAAHE